MSAQHTQTKAAVSVTEMARMVGLSRARFYQLIGSGTFPSPTYAPDTGRPYFDEEQQATCLKVRNRNIGIDGKPVLFYARRIEVRPIARRSRRPDESRTHSATHAALLEAVQTLGLASATSAQVEEAIAELYLHGTEGIDPSEMIRAVFLRLQRRDSTTSGRLA